MKTAREHAEDFVESCGGNKVSEVQPQILELVRSVFDTCIEVAQDEVDVVAVARRYKDKGEGYSMALGVVQQLRSLKGEL